MSFQDRLHQAFAAPLVLHRNLVLRSDGLLPARQLQTSQAFTEKWKKYESSDEKERLFQFQRDWYLRLYGFETEVALAQFLASKDVILDAGCGLGFKSAWFAQLAPHALVIGMDLSDSAIQAAHTYPELQNLFFIQGDIAHTGLRDTSVAYVSCDQVIMHTEDPAATFTELARVTRRDGEFACYFYAKKALPRELLDEHFRSLCMTMERPALWALSEQLTELGRRLSALDVSFDCPDIPALGIVGGRQDVQRFVYWNFLKCFWNEQLGVENSVLVNFDWYSPSNARRFSEQEVRDLASANQMVERFFHAEQACYSGRFARRVPLAGPA